MKQAIPILLASLLLLACGPNDDEFRLKGEIEGMELSDLLIYNTDGSEPRLDTIHVKEGRFAYAGHARSATPYILVFPNAYEQVIFASGGAALEYEAKASDLNNYRVKGTKENELLNDFRRDTRRANPIETRDRAEQYIRKHADSPAVLYLFDRYFVQDPTADPTKIADLRAMLEQHHPNDRLLIALTRELKNEGNAQTGKTVSLPDSIITAPHTLLYFWASWQPVAWSNIGNLRKAVYQYNRRQLNTVTVSVDVTDFQWKSFTHEPDTSAIRHLYDGLSWDTPLAHTFNVHQLPTYIIINRQKKILSRFTDPTQLEAELKKHVHN